MRMRTLLTMLAAGAMTVGIVGCGSAQKSTNGATNGSAMVSGNEPITTDTATLTVHGMGCPLCANNVDKQLKDVPGVTDVRVDMGTGRVTVYLAEANRPSKAQLARAIDQSGFTLVRIDTP